MLDLLELILDFLFGPNSLEVTLFILAIISSLVSLYFFISGSIGLGIGLMLLNILLWLLFYCLTHTFYY